MKKQASRPPTATKSASTSARRRFLYFGAIYVLLWIGTWYSSRLMNTHGFVSLWFLPSGLRFCNLLVFGRRGLYLELLIQGIFAAAQFTPIDGPPIQDIFSENTAWRAYNLLASLAANAVVVFPLRRWMRAPWDLTRPGHSALLIGAALLVSALSGLAGAFGILQLGFIKPSELPDVVAGWLAGDLVGILTLAPLLLVRIVPWLRHFLATGRGKALQASPTADVATTLLVWLSLLLVFGIPWSFDLYVNFPIVTLLLLLPLAGVAMHYGLRAAVLAIVLLDFGMVVLIAVFNIQEHALPYQLVMVAIVLVGLWLGGAVEARNRLMARYRDFASVSNDLLWEADATGHLLEASGALARHLPLSADRAPREKPHWLSILGDSPPAALDEFKATLQKREAFRDVELVLPDDSGNQRWIQVNGLPVIDDAGEFAGYRGTAVDVTRAHQADVLLRDYNEVLRREVAERTSAVRQSHSELAAKEKHLQVILAAVPLGVLELDKAQRCRFINVNGCALTGLSREEAEGRPLLDFVHAEDRDYVEFVLRVNEGSSEVHWLEFRLNRTDQRCSAHWISVGRGNAAGSGEETKDEAGASATADSTIMVLTSATARSQQDERLWTLAHHDALTDLPNRNLFWDRMGQALRYARRRESGAAVLWIDLDGFKSVNDRLGHAAGDALLKQVASRLLGRVRNSDTLARIGGDEFALIMPDIVDDGIALRTAQALVDALAEPFDLPQGEVRISGSIGVALYPQHADRVETLTQCADMAMYQAKNAGKNQVRLWNARREGEGSA